VRHLAVKGIESPRIKNTMRSSGERVRSSYLKGGTQGSLNLLSRTKIKIWILGREERGQAMDLNGAFQFSEWPTDLEGRWGSIYIPHLKKKPFGSFSPTKSDVRWTSLKAGVKHLEAGLIPDKFG
jgi:hypothetical protein